MPKNFKTLAIIEKQTQDEMKIYNVLYLLMELKYIVKNFPTWKILTPDSFINERLQTFKKETT